MATTLTSAMAAATKAMTLRALLVVLGISIHWVSVGVSTTIEMGRTRTAPFCGIDQNGGKQAVLAYSDRISSYDANALLRKCWNHLLSSSLMIWRGLTGSTAGQTLACYGSCGTTPTLFGCHPLEPSRRMVSSMSIPRLMG